MSGEMLRSHITSQFPHESADDVITMIDVLAVERFIARGGGLKDEVFGFAAGFWCPLSDPVKNDSFKAQIAEVRRDYRNIAQSRELRVRLRGSLPEEILLAGSLAEAVTATLEKNLIDHLKGLVPRY
jgi:hypothetical protein